MTGRFELVTLDLDGTLLPDTTAFQVILAANGKAAQVAASDARFFAGGITLRQCFEEQWELVQSLSLADMHRALRTGPWLTGIADGVAALRQHGIEVAMLTDQPSTVTDFLGRWGIEQSICSPVTVVEGRQVDIEFHEHKWDNLDRFLSDHHVAPERVCHVGNGANDVPVWGHVGAGLAVFAAPEVARAATVDLGRPASLPTIVDAVLELHRGGK